MAMIRVGVVRGGPGHEYEVSLKTGQSVLKYLAPEKYQTKDILITRDGTWHLNGLETTPDRLTPQVDLIFNALHGEYGEDGEIQALLDDLGIPYTGSGRLASARAINKQLTKEALKESGLKMAEGLVVRSEDDIPVKIKEIFMKLAPPWIIKPLDSGSSVGLAYALTVSQLAEAIIESLNYSDQTLVERYLRGKEATCGVVDNFRHHEFYALPPIEIRKPEGHKIWNYEFKYNGQTAEVCPGNFTDEEKRELAEASIKIHKILGLRHYSRSDFIVNPKGVYFLEVNTLPGMTSESLLPKALDAVGCSYPQFLDHVISLALEK